MKSEKTIYRKYILFVFVLVALLLIAGKNIELAKASTYSETMLYRVQPGETLTSISRKFDENSQNIATKNNLSQLDSIYSGQLLLIDGNVTTESFTTRTRLNNSEFIQRFANSASQIAKEHGLYASVMIAQAILESDYGNSVLASPPFHNLFGIKGAYNNQSVVMTTDEYLNQEWITKHENFRRYPNYYASLLNNARLIRNGNAWDRYYYQGAWIENTNSYQDATDWLENRYATDPYYASKLNNIIVRYNLTQYDQTEKRMQNPQPVSTLSESNKRTHTVAAGDTLFNIAQRYQTSVAELININGLTSNTIKIGQQLNLVGNSSSVNSTEMHLVEKGDTLYNIANRYGTTVSQLKASNQLSSNHIILGQKLMINATTDSSGESRQHTVQVGDTLYNIARRYNVTVDSIIIKNNLNSNTIRIGQIISY